MTTFELADVRRFTAELDARMTQCDTSEGLACAKLDDSLHLYASLCCQFLKGVREWGQAVFQGQAAFDPSVEHLWLSEGSELFRRAREIWGYGQEMEGDCFVLQNGAALGAALWRLERMLSSWVTPRPATAPLVRHGVAQTPAAKEEAQRRVDALPPLARGWLPTHARQRSIFNKLQRPA